MSEFNTLTDNPNVHFEANEMIENVFDEVETVFDGEQAVLEEGVDVDL